MTDQWMCRCGEPWEGRRHKVQMKREVGNNLWRGSPALLIPHRQWLREAMPNGNQGFVCVGDDGFIRGGWDGFHDVGYIALMEWKSNTRGPVQKPKVDHATGLLLDAVPGDRIVGSILVQLAGGNTPDRLHHYPVAREIAPGDWLPEAPMVAQTIYANHKVVSVAELRDLMLSAVMAIGERRVA